MASLNVMCKAKPILPNWEETECERLRLETLTKSRTVTQPLLAFPSYTLVQLTTRIEIPLFLPVQQHCHTCLNLNSLDR